MISPKKVDILDDVLTNTDEGAFPGLAELSDLLTRPVRSTQPEASAPESRPEKKAFQKKNKVTHYLSPEISEGLDRVLPQIRNLVPQKARKKISKSRVVDSSLRLLLREFEVKGKESLLVRQFLNKGREGKGS